MTGFGSGGLGHPASGEALMVWKALLSNFSVNSNDAVPLVTNMRRGFEDLMSSGMKALVMMCDPVTFCRWRVGTSQPICRRAAVGVRDKTDSSDLRYPMSYSSLHE